MIALRTIPIAPALVRAGAIILALATGAAAAETTDPLDRSVPTAQALESLGSELSDSVRRTQSDPTIPEILAELDRNIAATRRMRELVESDTEITDEQVAEITREIGEIASSFRVIAELAPGVFERRMAEISSIEGIGAKVDFRIADARARMSELAGDNEAISGMLRNDALPHSEIEKLRLTRQANEAEMHALEASIAAWSFFAERRDEIAGRIDDQSDDLDVFFHALKENARVYEAAAQTLSLANSVGQALGDLDSLQNLDALRTQLVQSWGDLMKIVDEVNNGLVLQPGM